MAILQILPVSSSMRENMAATVSCICQLWPGAHVGQGCSSFSCSETPGPRALSLLRVFSFAHNRKQSTSFRLRFLYLFWDETMIRTSLVFVVTCLFCQVRLLVREPPHHCSLTSLNFSLDQGLQSTFCTWPLCHTQSHCVLYVSNVSFMSSL